MGGDLLVLMVVSVLALMPFRRGDLPGCLLLVVGSALEIVGDTVTVMGAGGVLVALGMTLLGGRRDGAGLMAFGSLFLFLIGASMAVAFTGTEDLKFLRYSLGGVPDPAARGLVVTVWMALLIRLVAFPAAQARGTAPSMLTAIGPAWWSAAVLLSRWGGILPQALLESCRVVCAPVTAVILVGSAVWAMRPAPWPRAAVAMATGMGALVAFAAWCGGQAGAEGGRLLMVSTAVAGCALGWTAKPGGAAGVLATALVLLVLGFPLGAGYAGRLRIIGGIGGVGSAVGVMALLWWVLPLAGWLRHGFPVNRQPAPVWRLIPLTVGVLGAVAGGLLVPWGFQ